VLFALAVMIWAGCSLATLGLAGAASSFCAGDGHFVPGCSTVREAMLWLLAISVMIGGAWLMKRLVHRLGIKLG
jgi:hypothetical protein